MGFPAGWRADGHHSPESRAVAAAEAAEAAEAVGEGVMVISFRRPPRRCKERAGGAAF